MAGRVIAQILLQLTTVASRAFVSAYQQALQNAKAGGGGGAAAAASAAVKSAVGKGKMQSDEALKILNIERAALSRPVLEEQYKKFFEQNDPKKGGSFYIQSKVYRAREALDVELSPSADKPPSGGNEEPPGGGSGSGEAGGSSSSGSSSASSSGSGGSSGGNRFDRFKR